MVSTAVRVAAYEERFGPGSASLASPSASSLPVEALAAFPQGRLQQKAELFLAGSWVDVTPYVYARDSTTITRGRSDEAGTVDPTQVRLTVDNRDGRWSTRNPRGAWYGLLARNTPYRHSVNLGPSRLLFGGQPAVGDYVACPDTAALSVVGDIDLRWDGDLWSYRRSTNLILKSESIGDQVSYGMLLSSTGLLQLFWSPTGVFGAAIVVSSTVGVPYPDCGRRALRATLDVDNGAAGNTVTFYTSDTIAGTWTQLGDPVVTAGVTSIFNSTAPLFIGGTTVAPAPADVYAVQVRSGIGGTLVADTDFTTQTDAVSGFTDATGNGWSVAGGAQVTPWRVRGTVELSSFPVRWDVSGTDVYVPVTGAGILRRLQQGSTPVRSSIFRATLQSAALRAYWPMEDNADATSFGSATGNGRPMTVNGSAVAYADSDVFRCSTPLPTLSTAILTGRVPAYADTGEVQVRHLISVAAGGLTNGGILSRTYTSGTAPIWDVVYGTGGTLTLNAYDTSGALAATSGAIAFGMNGTDSSLSLLLTQTGGNVDWEIQKYPIGATVISSASGTVAGVTAGRCTAVALNRSANIGAVVLGHLAVEAEVTQTWDLFAALDAHLGEAASVRIERLCGEEGIPFRRVGTYLDTTALGYQTPSPLLDLLREAADADNGLLYEPRDLAGLAYKAGRSLDAQQVSLSLDYGSAQLDVFDPTDDDQATRNDVTVTRTGGASARAVQTAGVLGTAQVGVYDTSVDLSLAYDDQAADQAWWRVHLGTVDETRFPTVGVRLENGRFTG